MDMDALRGKEGDAAQVYFNCFSARIVPAQREAFRMNGRSRRPPLDPGRTCCCRFVQYLADA